mmetsp:Transcript_9360/g.24194  ORF Transcript_9360/g.24194 Transcript_9360/m.24194 type:complete len:187 (-) Transcript_9360:7-567(-)
MRVSNWCRQTNRTALIAPPSGCAPAHGLPRPALRKRSLSAAWYYPLPCCVLQVLERLERLKPDVMPPGKSATDFDDGVAARVWTRALSCCLETAFMQYKHPWARPSVDALVKLAMGSRRQWKPEEARQIEEWNQACKNGAVRKATGVGGSFMTSFDKDAARWRAANVSTAKKKDESGTGNAEANML